MLDCEYWVYTEESSVVDQKWLFRIRICYSDFIRSRSGSCLRFWIRMLTFSHPGSRIQGSKKHPIPDSGSGSATLNAQKKVLRIWDVYLGYEKIQRPQKCSWSSWIRIWSCIWIRSRTGNLDLQFREAVSGVGSRTVIWIYGSAEPDLEPKENLRLPNTVESGLIPVDNKTTVSATR
jgi:hypothetical protein